MPSSPLIFAHRGAAAVVPPNTMLAFEKALEMGADGIELDVHASKDERLVIIHDFDVDATTNASGPVAGFTAAELAAMDAGSHFGAEFAGIGVPTLDEVFDLVGDRCIVNVEIKTLDYLTGGKAVEPVARMIRERNLYDQVIVSAFNPLPLIRLRHRDPKIRLGLLYFEQLPTSLWEAWMSPLIQPEALHPHHAMVDEASVVRAKARGQAVNVWTVNEVDEARRLADLGVDAIITDVPDELMAALRSS
jgi:glycerophosphoryl diester phosphodiesterase